MKCPKCGYNSFEHQEQCKKCGQGLAEHKAKFNLRGFFFADRTASAQPVVAEDNDLDDDLDQPGDDAVDFGFDFLDEEDDQAKDARSPLGKNGKSLSIDQPFDVDSETVPPDTAPPGGKNGKGSEFVF